MLLQKKAVVFGYSSESIEWPHKPYKSQQPPLSGRDLQATQHLGWMDDRLTIQPAIVRNQKQQQQPYPQKTNLQFQPLFVIVNQTIILYTKPTIHSICSHYQVWSWYGVGFPFGCYFDLCLGTKSIWGVRFSNNNDMLFKGIRSLKLSQR